MKEIRLHGRGGQGAAAAAQILSVAFVNEGKWASGFAVFGVQRRGAALAAFCRCDDKPIREKTRVYTPDCLVVIDPTLIQTPGVLDGIKPGGILILNTPSATVERYHPNLGAIAIVDATAIALRETGTAITNTCMLGALVRATGWVRLDSVQTALEDYFNGAVLEKNKRCVQKGFEESKVITF